MTDEQTEGGLSSRFDLSREQITSAPLYRVLPLLAAPLLVQNLIWVAQQVVDLLWLGRYSDAAVAAVGLASPGFELLLAAVIYAPFIGTQVVASRRVGDDDPAAARRTVFAGLATTVALGVVFGGAVYLAGDAIISLLVSGQPGSEATEVADLAVGYLRIVSLGIAVAAASDVLEAGFVAWGNSRASLYVNLTSVVLNVGLDPVFIFGLGPVPELGVRGAAIASVCGYGAGVVLAVALVARGGRPVLSLDAVTFDPAEYRTILRVGTPSAMQRLARPVAELVIVAVVFLAAGPPGTAAYIVGTRIASVAYTPSQGLQQATQTVVGQNLGADRADRANRATWLGVGLITVSLGAFAVVQLLFPAELATLFVPELEAEALGLSVLFLQLYALGYPGLGALSLFQAGFNGAERTSISMVASLLKYWGIRVPVAVVGGLVLSHGVVAVFWAVPVSNILTGVGAAAYYRHWTSGGGLDRATVPADG